MEDPDPQVLQSLVDSNPWIAQDRRFLESLTSGYQKDSDVFKEVASLVEKLQLAPFQQASEQSVYQSASGTLKGPEAGAEPTRNNADTGPVGVSPLPALRVALPKLNKSQRRMSFDLMLMSQNPSLSTLPATAVSGVTVETKATGLKATNYRPLHSPAKKSLKSIFTIPKKPGSSRHRIANASQAAVESASAPAHTASVAPTEPKGTSEPEVQKNGTDADSGGSLDKGPMPPTAENKAPNGLAQKAVRRTSLVGKNLPVYIQEQIRSLTRERRFETPSQVPVEAPTPKVPIHENTAQRTSPFHGAPDENSPGVVSSPTQTEASKREPTASESPKTLTKFRSPKRSARPSAASTPLSRSSNNSVRKDPRISNLLANSSSFYYGHESQHQETETSTVSEAEREYISPDSFTRSIERLSQSYNSADTQENDSSEDEDTDMYLFQ